MANATKIPGKENILAALQRSLNRNPAEAEVLQKFVQSKVAKLPIRKKSAAQRAAFVDATYRKVHAAALKSSACKRAAKKIASDLVSTPGSSIAVGKSVQPEVIGLDDALLIVLLVVAVAVYVYVVMSIK
jgi:hypothetical protein